jgi:hypothetical protein
MYASNFRIIRELHFGTSYPHIQIRSITDELRTIDTNPIKKKIIIIN